MPLSVYNSVQNVLIATMLETVSAGKEKAIRLYELQPDSEKLVQHEQYNLLGSPDSQFVSPDGQRLCVSVRSANSIAAFHIDKAKKNWFHLAQPTSAQTQHM